MIKLYEKMLKKLNLGCGEFKKKGYVNLDYNPALKPDVLHDLNKFPYPFKDDEFDLVEADHVLEHLDSPFRVMKELHRICKKGAVIIIRVPHFTRGFIHAEHKRSFDVTFFLYFNPAFKGGYQGIELKTEKMRLHWFGYAHLKKSILPSYAYYPGYLLGILLDFFARLSPVLCSRLWSFWVGGFDEIEFRFIVKK